jgi:hypothetical protein
VAVPRLHRLTSLLRRTHLARPVGSALRVLTRQERYRKVADLLAHADTGIAATWRAYRGLLAESWPRLAGGESDDVLPQPEVPENVHSFWQVSALELQGFLTPQLLRDSDVFTMRRGIELRTPFVDHQLLQSVVTMGVWSRSGRESYKTSLWKQLNGFLPAYLASQPKRGFTIPVAEWLRKALVSRPDPAADDFVAVMAQPQYLRYREAFLTGAMHWSRVWGVYVLDRFRRLYDVA